MATNKNDVELRRIQSREKLWSIVAYGGVTVACILASYLPLSEVRGIIEPLAGETTTVNANVVVTIGLSASFVVNGLQWLKLRSQRRDLKLVRNRTFELEAKLGYERA